MKNKPISQKNEPDWIVRQAEKPDIPVVPDSVKEKDNGNDDSAELVNYMIKKYDGNKDNIPVKNISINIETDENQYKLIRLNDEQYYQLYQYSIALFDDYAHIMDLFWAENCIFSSFSKMYTVLKMIFGESGEYYDHWKGTFSFPFLICFNKNGEEFGYLMNLYNIKSSIEFRIAKLINADGDFDKDILHNPFEEFPREEIRRFTDYLIGFLTGYFKSAARRYDVPFVQKVESNLILFGYQDGKFFDYQFDDEDELNEEIQKLQKEF